MEGCNLGERVGLCCEAESCGFVSRMARELHKEQRGLSGEA